MATLPDEELAIAVSHLSRVGHHQSAYEVAKQLAGGRDRHLNSSHEGAVHRAAYTPVELAEHDALLLADSW